MIGRLYSKAIFREIKMVPPNNTIEEDRLQASLHFVFAPLTRPLIVSVRNVGNQQISAVGEIRPSAHRSPVATCSRVEL
jgi:hypothetical protein